MIAVLLLVLAMELPPEGGSYLPQVLAMDQQAAPRDARSTTAATGSISGVVTTDEAQPRPLRRARVTLNGAAFDIGRTAITADDGAFRFDGVPAGRFTVAASKDAYITMAYGASRPQRPGLSVTVEERRMTRIVLRLPRGAVITGTVTDVDGQPASGITVTVLARRVSVSAFEPIRYATAGTPAVATTDDRGVYRIYGVPAGEYVVAAQPTEGQGLPPGTAGSVVQMMSRGTVGSRRMLLSQVFHPGVTEVGRASRVTVRAGEERTSIDIQLEYVPLAAVSGTVSFPGSSPARVTLWRTDEVARGQTAPVATADSGGRFQFPSVAPGEYRVTARAGRAPAASTGRGGSPGDDAQYATADVVVNGEDVDVPLTILPALSISGRVVFDSDREFRPALASPLRISIPGFAAPANGGWPLPQAVVDGTSFRVDGIIPGVYRTTPNLQGVRVPIGGWWLKSLVVGGHDVLDAPLDMRQSDDVAVVTFMDRASTLTGTARDAAGAVAFDIWVVAFTAERSGWFANSRRIAAVRPDREGRYTIRNLPPGDYRLAAVADLEQGEWFDPSVLERLLPAATPLRIAGTESQTFDLTGRWQ